MRRQSKLGGCAPTSGLRPSTSGAFGVNGILPVFSEEASSAKVNVKMVNREELKTRVVEALGASRLVRLPNGGAEGAWQLLLSSGHSRGDLPHPAMSAAQAALKRAFSTTSLDTPAARFLTPFIEAQCRNCGRSFQPSHASLLEDPCYPHDFPGAHSLGDVVESPHLHWFKLNCCEQKMYKGCHMTQVPADSDSLALCPRSVPTWHSVWPEPPSLWSASCIVSSSGWPWASIMPPPGPDPFSSLDCRTRTKLSLWNQFTPKLRNQAYGGRHGESIDDEDASSLKTGEQEEEWASEQDGVASIDSRTAYFRTRQSGESVRQR